MTRCVVAEADVAERRFSRGHRSSSCRFPDVEVDVVRTTFFKPAITVQVTAPAAWLKRTSRATFFKGRGNEAQTRADVVEAEADVA